MIASILSKKIAAGVTHLVLDMPVGPTAKVRDESRPQLERGLFAAAEAFGIRVRVVPATAASPSAAESGRRWKRGMFWPFCKASADAPRDLRDRALELAGAFWN